MKIKHLKYLRAEHQSVVAALVTYYQQDNKTPEHIAAIRCLEDYKSQLKKQIVQTVLAG